MSIDTLLPNGLAGRAVPAVRARAFALPARSCLAGIVAISFVARALVSLWHVTPRYFPDEYIYSALARSIAETHTLTIRGGPAHFPALLEPLLAAPFWLAHDPALAYRLTLGMHALAMSLAAVPVYWLARRLGRGSGTALACAAFAVVLPDLVYANYVTADAVAYPLALGAVAAAVAAVERPTRRAQIALVVLCGLATFARVQYVVVPFVFVLAAVAAERGHVVRAARRYRLALALFALPVAAVAVAGPGRALGYYRGLVDLSLEPASIGHWIAVDSMLLVYAGGFVLVPGAVVGVLAAAVRARTRVEAAFAHVTLGFAASLLLEAGLYAANGSARFQERYLFALLPLVPIAFTVVPGRARLRIPVAALAAGLLLLALRVPLSGYTSGTGRQDSPLLSVAYELEQRLGSYGSGSLALVTIVAVLALIAVATAFRPRIGVAVSFAAALVVLSLASAAVLSYDRTTALRAAFTYLPRDYRFVDHAGLGRVSVLVPPGYLRPALSEHLFWNESLDRVLLLPSADAPDAFGHDSVRIAHDGRIMRGARPVSGPLLVEGYSSTLTLADARPVVSSPLSTLWRLHGPARVSTFAKGRYFDGWLASESSITVWPDASGTANGVLRLTLYLPKGVTGGSVLLTAPGYRRTVSVPPGATRNVEIPVHHRSPFTLGLRSTALRFLSDGRDVSVEARVPVFERAPLKARSAAADRG